MESTQDLVGSILSFGSGMIVHAPHETNCTFSITNFKDLFVLNQNIIHGLHNCVEATEMTARLKSRVLAILIHTFCIITHTYTDHYTLIAHGEGALQYIK